MLALTGAALVTLALARISFATGLADVLDSYVERPAADSAITMLLALPSLSGAEAEAGRFLVANDLAEMGLDDTAAMLFRSLATSALLAPAAFAGLARLRDARGEDQELRLEAKDAPWQRMNAEDRAEAAYHVARACFRDRRYPETRWWADQVPASSPFYPFVRFLLAQAEYAFGENARAIEAAEPIFSSRLPANVIGALQERTAVMLAEMFTELGLFTHAADLLAWPGANSAFRGRIERDRMVLESLTALGRHSFDEAEAASWRIETSFDAAAGEIEATVASPEGLDARAAELARSWPPRGALSLRRAWAAGHARDALATANRGRLGRAFAGVFGTLAAPRIRSVDDGRSSEPAAVSAESRFFFAPSRSVDRALAASALLVEPSRPGCMGNAARILRERAAASLIAERPEPGASDLALIAAGCSDEAIDGLTGRVQAKLRGAISDEARRQSRALRRQQYTVKEAIAHARLDEETALLLVEKPH